MRLEERQEVAARRLGRIAGLVPDAPGEAPASPTSPVADVVPGLVPVPGRHARRRPGEGAGGLRGLPGLALEGRHLGVLAMVACIGLALTLWWLLARTPTIATDLAGTTTSASSTPSDAPLVDLDATGTATAATEGSASLAPRTAVTIDVAGLVKRPGVRTLPAGSRVVDALQAAGGARRGADLSGINQARVLVDGEQILVGRQGAAAATAPTGAGTAGGSAGGAGALVNLNTATAEELDTLPGVGPVTAAAILDYRTQHGGFAAVAELLEIEGIGEKTLAKLEPHVTV